MQVHEFLDFVKRHNLKLSANVVVAVGDEQREITDIGYDSGVEFSATQYGEVTRGEKTIVLTVAE